MPESQMMLLQTILTSLQDQGRKLDASLERMATKDDVEMMRDLFRTAATQPEVDYLRERLTQAELEIRGLQESKLPQWLTSTLAAVVLSPVGGLLAAHFWH